MAWKIGCFLIHMMDVIVVFCSLYSTAHGKSGLEVTLIEQTPMTTRGALYDNLLGVFILFELREKSWRGIFKT